MKQHIRLKLKQGISDKKIPHWQDILDNKKIAGEKLEGAIDKIFAKYKLPVWVTKEYKPAAQYWGRDELKSGLNRIYRLILQHHSRIPRELIQEVSLVPIVESVEVGEVGKANLPSMIPAQMSVQTDLRSRLEVGLSEAQYYTRGVYDITVAVLDTGIDLSHPELEDVLLPGQDFVNIIDGANQFLGDYLDYDDVPDDEVGHGTHVAGIIAAKGLRMPVGVVPGCKVLPVRVLGALAQGKKRVGAGLVDNINTGIKWAIDKGADVINMSLGIRHTGGGLPHQEVVDYAERKGVTIVAASGNDGAQQFYYPGALPYAIAVGAMDETGEVASFSTYGKQVSFVAPGTNIYSAYLNDDYAFSSGTSHASPFIAGAVAMLKSYALEQKDMRLSDSQVKYILKHTADKIDTRFKHPKAGFGKLNLIDALRLLDYKLKF